MHSSQQAVLNVVYLPVRSSVKNPLICLKAVETSNLLET